MLPHKSVLLKDVLSFFSEKKLGIFVDGTIGAGGHAEGFLLAHPEIEQFIGIDQDPEALELAKKKLTPWEEKVALFKGNFSNLQNYLQVLHIEEVDGILIDIGVSSMQLDHPDRGFSFLKDGPLDMRMDPHLPLSAEDLVNDLSEEELGRIFKDYGEERHWKKAAKAIVSSRQKKHLSRTLELVQILEPLLKEPPWKKQRIHPLTKIFQALRIAVNHEIERLSEFLEIAIKVLKPGGRLAVISFHSLEDRLVKQFFQKKASDKVTTSGIGGIFLDKKQELKILTKKPICPAESEMAINPRSRSAKLRVVEKL